MVDYPFGEKVIVELVYLNHLCLLFMHFVQVFIYCIKPANQQQLDSLQLFFLIYIA